MKRSWPEATPVALEPRRCEGKPCETWLASGLTSPIALPCLHINFCSDSCLLSSAFLCRTAEQVQAGRCREVPAGRASYVVDWENQRGRMVAHTLGRSVHRDFFVNLGKARKTGCKPNSSYSGVRCAILGFKAWM